MNRVNEIAQRPDYHTGLGGNIVGERNRDN